MSRPGLAAAPVPVVRPAGPGDGAALHRLSRLFVPGGALRERPADAYVRAAGDFLVAEDPAGGGLQGCAALRTYPRPTEAGHGTGHGPVAVVYNVCVAPRSQGRGIGTALLRALLADAALARVSAVFTATAGGGELFLRHGFVPGDGQGAPAAWLAALDPRRGSRILSRRLPASG
ncbi:GNAT family N-acetyltransferase [Streptomyces sp. NPDC005805]|uniref:GNAT family N-acetyltransferase n=1 Tax=Streptomyces sp. NPDC005805 TaxID=3157068 RepID=UPI0033EA5A87